MTKSQEITYLTYKGIVLYDTIGDLIIELKEVMFEAKVKPAIYKKLLMIMIEALENIYKYHEYFVDESDMLSGYPPGIIIKSSDKFFFVECFNPVRKVDVIKLSKRLKHVNSLDKAGIKQEYKQIITNGQFSEKGGAGLGIIEMAKITDEKIDYSFRVINNKFDYYRLTLKIKCD